MFQGRCPARALSKRPRQRCLPSLCCCGGRSVLLIAQVDCQFSPSDCSGRARVGQPPCRHTFKETFLCLLSSPQLTAFLPSPQSHALQANPRCCHLFRHLISSPNSRIPPAISLASPKPKSTHCDYSFIPFRHSPFFSWLHPSLIDFMHPAPAPGPRQISHAWPFKLAHPAWPLRTAHPTRCPVLAIPPTLH